MMINQYMLTTAGEPNRTRIVFVNDGFHLGGIEVLELKLANRFAELGFSVVITCDRHTDKIPVGDHINVMRHAGLHDLIERHKLLAESPVDRIILASFHPISAVASIVLAERLRQYASADVSIFHWVSHSRAFFFSRNPLRLALLRWFFFRLPKTSCYFMNDAARDFHQRYWNKNLSDYPVLRIVGRMPDKIKSNFDLGDRLRIVSIGRLVPFKSYNAASPGILRELTNQGLEVHWDVWGYGPDEEKILAEAQKHRVFDRIRLRGSLDHSIYDSVVSDYDIFVGMGTAALEAGKACVPTILALENGEDRGYGFLASAPSDSVGDLVEGQSEERIAETIRAFSRLKPSEREKLGTECRAAAIKRESALDDFVLAILQGAGKANVGLVHRAWITLLGRYFVFKVWKFRRSR